jgi:hypothetical protein
VLQWRRDDILQTLTEADYAFLGDTKDMPRRSVPMLLLPVPTGSGEFMRFTTE